MLLKALQLVSRTHPQPAPEKMGRVGLGQGWGGGISSSVNTSKSKTRRKQDVFTMQKLLKLVTFLRRKRLEGREAGRSVVTMAAWAEGVSAGGRRRLGGNDVPYREEEPPGEATVLGDKTLMQRFEAAAHPGQEYCGTWMISRCSKVFFVFFSLQTKKKN